MVEGSPVFVYRGARLARYGFGGGHPFGSDRQQAFWAGLEKAGLASRVEVREPRQAGRAELELFHTRAYVDLVERMSAEGEGLLDYGDTPAFPGCYEAGAIVVGTVLDALGQIATGACRRAFIPVAGLHHARRGSAGGFCVFNDCGVAVEAARARHGLRRLAYVDIDAHHGDGVYYDFEEDPELFVADIHEDGRFLYPGTGSAREIGRGRAAGTKLSIPLLPGAGDEDFRAAWARVEEHVDRARPELILFQCGADGLAGDPLTHLGYTAASHALAAAGLCRLADAYCGGRLLALGGGGYDLSNCAAAWTEVIRAMVGEGG